MIMIRKMTNAVLISMLTGAMAILISGCSNNSTPQSTKSTSASTNTQVASSENTTASDIATTADDSAESVTSIKKDGYLAIPIADLSQTASFYKADLDGTEVEIVASDRTVTDDEIQISYDVLKATADELPKFFQ